MKPLKAVVTKVAKDYITIELRSGTTFSVKKVGGIDRGAAVDVYYDYTRNRVRDIRLSGERDVPIFGEAPDNDAYEMITHPEFEDVEESVEEEVGAPSLPETEEVLEIKEWELEQELLETGASSSPESKEFQFKESLS